jgi:hypothetical protein
LIAIFALLLFALFWSGLLMLFAHLGGWAAIAQQYPDKATPISKTLWMQSARFGWVDYNGVLTMHMSDQGLGIAALLPFRPGHAPMFLPWSALKVVEVNDHWWGRYVTVEVGSPVIGRVRLPLKIMAEARQIS